MAIIITKLFFYLVATILSILCFIYFIIKAIDTRSGYGYISYLSPFSFAFICGTIVYFLYMSLNSLKGNQVNAEPLLVNNQNTLFLKDVYFKYLCSFAIALAIFYVINMIAKKFEVFGVFSNWVLFYTNLVLPILIIIDAVYFSHLRCHTFCRDIMIIAIILVIHFVYFVLWNIIYWGFHDGIEVWAFMLSSNLALFIYSFNGYILYDYILYRKTGSGNYVAFA